MKVLHMSFHTGCQNDIEYMAKELNLDLTFMEFDDGITKTNTKYNIGHKRAEDCWNKYKDYFNTFDLVITSDTAPISRVFLQHNFSKKLIIWVCNRFDYYDSASLDCKFPDEEYYQLISSIKNKPNVIIAGNSFFENYYAKNIKNTDIGSLVIKPIGCMSKLYENYNNTDVENKNETFFIPQYHNETILMNLHSKLTELNIKSFNGRHGGLKDLQQFKGIIHIPYAWSTISMYESFHLGMIYFIPSITFIMTLSGSGNFWFQPPFSKELLKLSEWYNDDNKENFVYFDSWEDLKNKINSTDYGLKKQLILSFAKEHCNKQLDMWRKYILS